MYPMTHTSIPIEDNFHRGVENMVHTPIEANFKRILQVIILQD